MFDPMNVFMHDTNKQVFVLSAFGAASYVPSIVLERPLFLWCHPV